MDDKDKIIEMQERYISELEQQNEAIRKALELLERELDKYNLEAEEKKKLQNDQQKLLEDYMKKMNPLNPQPSIPNPQPYHPQNPNPWTFPTVTWTDKTSDPQVKWVETDGQLKIDGNGEWTMNGNTLSGVMTEAYNTAKDMYYGYSEEEDNE
jgi:hypothetical protein